MFLLIDIIFWLSIAFILAYEYLYPDYDFVFLDEDRMTELTAQIYDRLPFSNQVTAWVKLPEVHHGKDTKFWVEYGGQKREHK